MTRIVLTYEDYAALPDDGKRYALHEGELSVTPAPDTRHQDVLVALTVILGAHVGATGVGKLLVAPYDCIMSDITVVQPDLVYTDDERLGLVSPRALEGAPTLSIEILSPSTGRTDRRRKMALYASHDVRWYWIVDPAARTIEVYRLEAGQYRLDTTLQGREARALPPLDDLTVDPTAVWRQLPR
jgi:Uma2 family endonuclease